jgi:hypothetical protein
MILSAKYWIDHLNLIPHPEGGYFREVFRSAEGIAGEHLPDRYQGERRFMTSIYFLVLSEHPALLHRVHSDELWVFLDGSPLTIHTIDPGGKYQAFLLGRAIHEGHTMQYCVPAGTWFGETIDSQGGYSLVACIVAPGFEYADFELAHRTEMIRLYPGLADIISKLTLPEEVKP